MSSLILRLPLWLRYAIAVGSAVILFTALVIYVHHHQAQSEGVAAAPNKVQAAQLQREAEVVVAQEQAPHTVKLAADTAPLAAARSAVVRYMTDQASMGLIPGPVDGHASCTATGGSSSRLRFSCSVRAGVTVTRLRYPFAAVVRPAAARVTYCQVITAPYPLKPVPLRAACR